MGIALLKAYLKPTNFINSSSQSSAIWSPIFGFALSLLFIYPVIDHFITRKRGVYVNSDGFKLTFPEQDTYLGWDEIEKVGFQAVILPSRIISEARSYVAIKLKDTTKCQNLKNHREFGFIQLKDDLKDYKKQENVFDLYFSLISAPENKSILDILKTRKEYIEKITPVVKTQSDEQYEKILKENFNKF
jgi:hypothetical protein